MTPTKQAARYKQALENIQAYVPYAYAKELAANALDLEQELMVIPAVTPLTIKQEKEDE